MPPDVTVFPPIKVGETYGQWSVDVDENGAALANVASATFRLVHRDTGRVVVNSAVATVLGNGTIVEYTRTAADVSTAGKYWGEFTINHNGGAVSKSQNILITIEPSI